MSAWTRLRSTLAEEARLTANVAPAILAAARAFQSAHQRRAETLHLGRSSITVRHDDRYRAYVTVAFVAGVMLGSAATVLLAPRPPADARVAADPQLRRWRPRLERVPHALRAARNAAMSAFRDTVFEASRTPTV